MEKDFLKPSSEFLSDVISELCGHVRYREIIMLLQSNTFVLIDNILSNDKIMRESIEVLRACGNEYSIERMKHDENHKFIFRRKVFEIYNGIETKSKGEYETIKNPDIKFIIFHKLVNYIQTSGVIPNDDSYIFNHIMKSLIPDQQSLAAIKSVYLNSDGGDREEVIAREFHKVYTLYLECSNVIQRVINKYVGRLEVVEDFYLRASLGNISTTGSSIAEKILKDSYAKRKGEGWFNKYELYTVSIEEIVKSAVNCSLEPKICRNTIFLLNVRLLGYIQNYSEFILSLRKQPITSIPIIKGD